MKSLLIKLLLVSSILSFSWINYAGSTYAATAPTAATAATGSGITVIVTEKIPGATCDPIYEDKKDSKKIVGYKCAIEKGIATVTKMLGNIIKYFTYIAALGGVLFIVINGILYSMGGADESFKTESKKRIIGTLIGLVLLMLSGVVLNAIAPWIYVGK